MHEIPSTSKSGGVLLGAWRTLKPSPRVFCAGLLFCGGWSMIHAGRLAASATVVSTFAVPMAIGALFGAIASSLAELTAVRPMVEIDWGERIRIGLLAIGPCFSLFRYILGHQAASTWFAFVGGALVMNALVLMLQLLKGPSRPVVERAE